MASDKLTKEQIESLRNYKYKSENHSILSPYLDVYWTWMAKHTPITLAPNAITLAGLVIVIGTGLTVMFYTRDGDQNVPSWVHLLCAVGLFAYQTLDALDGHQARRLKLDTPFEELIDHGFDAVSTVFVSLNVCAALQLGPYPMVMLVHHSMAMVCCYLATFQTYITGIVYFKRFDVTEAIIVVTVLHLVCAVFPSLFHATIPLLGITLGCGFAVANIFMSVVTSVSHVSVIAQHTNKPLRNGQSVLGPAIPVITWTCCQIFLVSTTSLYLDSKNVFLLTFGIMSAKFTNVLLVHHLYKMPVPVIDTWVIRPLLLCAISHVFPSHTEALWCVLILTIIDIVQYFVQTCNQFSEVLDTYTFSVTSRPSSKQKGVD